MLPFRSAPEAEGASLNFNLPHLIRVRSIGGDGRIRGEAKRAEGRYLQGFTVTERVRVLRGRVIGYI